MQVLSTLVIKCRGDFRIFQFASVIHCKKNAKDSVEIFVYYVGNGFSIHQHFTKGYDLVF